MRLADVSICVALLTFALLELSASRRIQPKETYAGDDHILQTIDEKGNAHGLTLEEKIRLVKSFASDAIAPFRGNASYYHRDSSMDHPSGRMIRTLYYAIAPVTFLFLFYFISRFHLKMELCSNCCSKRRNQYRYKGRLIYEWAQNASDVLLYIGLPEGITKRMIEVKIWPRHVKIGRSGKVPFLREELFGLIDDAASSWDVTASGELAVTLKKVSSSVDWPCVFLHHPHTRDRRVSTGSQSRCEEIAEIQEDMTASTCQSEQS